MQHVHVPSGKVVHIGFRPSEAGNSVETWETSGKLTLTIIHPPTAVANVVNR